MKRFGAPMLAALFLASCNTVIPTTTSTAYDLPEETAAKATATLASAPFCTGSTCSANLVFPAQPGIVVSTGAHCAGYDLATGRQVWVRSDISCALRGWQDDYNSLSVTVREHDGDPRILSLDAATGALFDRDGMDFTETHVADTRERMYQSTVDCLSPDDRMPGQPLFSGGTWQGGICTLIVEDEITGDPVATMPLGHDRFDDGRELQAFSSPDGDWVVVVDNRGIARSFRLEDL